MSTIASLIDRFGGVRPMARKVGVAVNSVQHWKRAGRLPVARIDAVKKAADDHGIGVTLEEVVAAALSGTRAAA